MTRTYPAYAVVESSGAMYSPGTGLYNYIKLIDILFLTMIL